MSQPPPIIRIELLDRFRILIDDREVPVPLTSALVLAHLAIRERPFQRSTLAGLVWPSIPEPRALGNLRTALYRLGRASVAVELKGREIELSAAVPVDLRETRHIARNLWRGGTPPADLDASIERLTRELLPDWDEIWLEPERERYRQLRLHALESLSRRLAGDGRLADAVEAAHAALVTEPASESAERALMDALVAEGNRALAARSFDRFRRRLWRDLRVRPSRELFLLRAAVAESSRPRTRTRPR
jgi:DNA-binding SARP family transcriptional activator